MRKIQHIFKGIVFLVCLTAPWLVLSSTKDGITIWNGNVVKSFSDYPYIVSINSTTGTPYNSHDCAGTFITKQYILTAGHCVTNRDGSIIKPNNMFVYYGGINLQKDHFQKFFVKAVLRYPGFHTGTLGLPIGDLAIIKIIPTATQIKTVSLVNPDLAPCLMAGKTVRTIGWGFYKAFSPVSPELRYADQSIGADQTLCNYLSSLGSPYICKFYDPNAMIGTFAFDTKRITQGDSGGPLLLLMDGVYIQVGITSWAPDVPTDKFNASFYTRLTNQQYWNWIQKTIQT